MVQGSTRLLRQRVHLDASFSQVNSLHRAQKHHHLSRPLRICCQIFIRNCALQCFESSFILSRRFSKVQEIGCAYQRGLQEGRVKEVRRAGFEFEQHAGLREESNKVCGGGTLASGFLIDPKHNRNPSSGLGASF